MAEEGKITQKDLYDKAYDYFEYHAGQRMNLLNYYIAVFGACVALYGSTLETMPLASALIGGFLCFVSVLFYKIDLRNQFDVKQSQHVLTQFERDRQTDLPACDGSQNAYGVFSNEDHVFNLYDSDFRKSKDYQSFLKEYKSAEDKNAVLKGYAQRFHVSAAELRASIRKSSIPHLSTCIHVLYISCMAAGALGVVAAAILCLRPVFA